MSRFFSGFADELAKLAAYGVAAPPPVTPPMPVQQNTMMAKAPKPPMTMKRIAPGSAQAKAINRRAAKLPKPKSAGQAAREAARSRAKLQNQAERSQSTAPGGGLTKEQAEALGRKLRGQ